MNIVTTSAKGQVVIPKKERKLLGTKPGSKVIIEAVGDHIEIRPVPDDPIEFYCGIFREGSSLTEALLKDSSNGDRVSPQELSHQVKGKGGRGEN